MDSTWRLRDRSEWTLYHWLYEVLGLHPTDPRKDVPIHGKLKAVPPMRQWSMHRWVIAHALLPVFLQHLYTTHTGRRFTVLQAAAFYTLALNLIAIRGLHILRRIGHQVGFLDGDACQRDGVPYRSVKKVLCSLLSWSALRPIIIVLVSYRASEPPADIDWRWLPLQIGLYGVVLDFWFYWYHRLEHELPCLWKYHRTHHLAKHPNALLLVYADSEDAFFNIIAIPVFSFYTMNAMNLPMSFYDWWICHLYVFVGEVAGHSGLRIHCSPPTTLHPLLRWLKCELVLEDHDLHHRTGWRSSGNYGKQTRLWDVIFGTCKDRIECLENNIAWECPINLPLL